MNRLRTAFAAALLLQGCTTLYPDTDLVEPNGFELKVATGIQKSGGLIQSGTLEYAGTGDLVPSFRDYVAAMRSNGWTGAADDIQNQKAVSTLRKDNRTCALEFTSANNVIKVTIKISQTK
jgi:hypothetical protein